MFKLTINTVEDCYPDGYHNNYEITLGKSPKQCWDKMARRINIHRSTSNKLGYGGTPVIQQVKLERGTKVIYDNWS